MPTARPLVIAAVLAAAILAIIGGCTPGPASISGRVSFEHYNDSRAFPPAAAPNIGTDDVLYIRLVDNDGAGAVLLTNEANPALIPDLASDVPTPQQGVFLDTFLFTVSDAVIDAATMPLRLEAYLYDDPAAGAVDPGTDAERYTYFADPATGGTWYVRLNLQKGEIKGGVALILELDINLYP